MSKTSSKQIKIGALLSYLGIALSILSALIYSPWMLSKIGKSDYGLYTLASSLINIFLIDFGISSAVSRFVTKYNAEGKQEEINNLLGLVYKLFMLISLIASIILLVIYFCIEGIYVKLTPEEIERFKVVFIISATYSVVSFPFASTLNGIMTSYEKFIQLKLCDVLHKVTTVVMIVVALLLGYGLYALVAAHAVSNLLFFLIKWIIIKTSTPVKVNLKYFDKSMLKEVFSFSIWVMINAICSRLIMNLCPNILGVTAGTLAITVFGFASTLEGYVHTFASAIDGMFMPKIARIAYKDTDGDTSKLLPLMTKVGRYQFAFICLIVVGFICVGYDFISLWIGSEYIDVYYCAILLMLPAPFYLSQQIGKSAMVVTGQVKYLTFVNIIKAVINVVLVFILSKFIGVIGAGLSICIAFFIRNIGNMILYQKKLNIDMKKFSIDCYLKLVPAILLSSIFAFVFTYFYSELGWLHLMIKICVIVIVYLLSIFFIGFNKDERSNVLKRFIKKKKVKNDV